MVAVLTPMEPGFGAKLAVLAVRVDVGGVAVAIEALFAGEAAVDDVVDGRGERAEGGREDEVFFVGVILSWVQSSDGRARASSGEEEEEEEEEEKGSFSPSF
ncbi:hypothetical protein NHJ13734_002007 [Beauveria thailandica]